MKIKYVPAKNSTYKEYKKIIVLILFIVFIFSIYFFMFDKKNNSNYIDYLSSCGIDNQGYLDGEADIINDYGIYGQSLTLFKNKYDIKQKDPFYGQIILVRNVCTGEISNFFIDKSLDKNIRLNSLNKGVYEFLIVDNLNYRPLVFNNSLDLSIELVKTDTKVRLLNAFIDADLKRKRLLMLVEDSLYQELDIMLNLISEKPNDIELQIIQDLKRNLENRGYTVIDSMKNNRNLSFNGEDGALYLAKEKGIKYLINIKYGDDLLLANSYYSKVNLLANERVYKRLIDKIYDYNDWIRESGGYLLASGQLKPQLIELNRWNKDNRRGINALNLYINNSQKAIEIVSEWLK